MSVRLFTDKVRYFLTICFTELSSNTGLTVFCLAQTAGLKEVLREERKEYCERKEAEAEAEKAAGDESSVKSVSEVKCEVRSSVLVIFSSFSEQIRGNGM